MKGLWVLSLAVGMAAGAAGCGSSATTCSEAGCVSTDDGGATGDGMVGPTQSAAAMSALKSRAERPLEIVRIDESEDLPDCFL